MSECRGVGGGGLQVGKLGLGRGEGGGAWGAVAVVGLGTGRQGLSENDWRGLWVTESMLPVPLPSKYPTPFAPADDRKVAARGMAFVAREMALCNRLGIPTLCVQ